MFSPQVFLVRKVKGSDAGQLYAMKVLKKATLKGEGRRGPATRLSCCCSLGEQAFGSVLRDSCVSTRHTLIDDTQHEHVPEYLTTPCALSRPPREAVLCR